MKYVKGNLIEMGKNGEFDVIVHGVNCCCRMGSGIAKSIREAFPTAYQLDLQTAIADRNKLGTCQSVQVDGLTIVNAYTQFDYIGPKPRVDYDAVRSCMKQIKKEFSGTRIGLPKIGAGLAGGDWDTIETIINEELENEDVKIVIFV